MKTVKINNIEINVEEKNIGLSLSGGADSAILCYILMKNSNNPIFIYTVASKEKNNITVKHSTEIIKKCIELTGNNNIFHNIKYVDKMERDDFLNFLVLQTNENNIDTIYTATTSVPFIENLKFKNKLNNEIVNRRNSNLKKNVYSHNNKLYHPFINLNKKDISQLYQELNVLDNLFPLTRSCESITEFDKHCQNCWWCEERFWAFGRYE